jgi:uncharacterized protein
MKAVALTEDFLGRIFTGDLEAALAMVAPDARFIGSRPEATPGNTLQGTHIGPEGGRHFFTAFAGMMEPGEFIVESRFGTDDEACLHGRLRHTIRLTGKPFPSDWALVTRFAGGRLVFYHFYEDTAALAEAMRPD